MTRRFRDFALPLLAVLPFASAHAQWVPDGVQLCTTAGAKTYPRAVVDGAGGAIVFWRDRRVPTSPYVFAQRIDANGVRMWPPGGVQVSGVVTTNSSPVTISDGAGGAIVAWVHVTGLLESNVWAQRINSAGALLWGIGVPICQAGTSAAPLMIISDFRGDQINSPGAIIAWTDFRNAGDEELFAQAVDANGAPYWTVNGVQVCAPDGGATTPLMLTDGMGVNPQGRKGALLLWADAHDDDFLDEPDLYARGVSFAGVPQGGADGSVVYQGGREQNFGAGAYAGLGNSSIVAWMDNRVIDTDIYAQKVSAGGTIAWAPNGVPLCTKSAIQSEVDVMADGFGGAIVAWRDPRAIDPGIYAQALNATGTPVWLLDGAAITTIPGLKFTPRLVPDLNGGAVVVWVDGRPSPTSNDIYAQRINAAGAVQWVAGGVPVCNANGGQGQIDVVGDYAGGGIVVWEDHRAGAFFDIYANRVSADGGVVDVAPGRVRGFRLFDAFPNPTSGSASVAFELSAPAKVTAQVYGVDGSLIRILAGGEFGAGPGTLHWDGTDGATPLPSGVYFLRVRAGAESDVRKILLAR